MLFHKTLAVALSAGLLAVAPSFAQYGQSGSQDKDKQQQSSSERNRDRDMASDRDDQNKSQSAASSGQLSASERKFLTNAAQDSLGEIELGKLAQEHGFTQQVKDLGKKLADDHQKALDKAKEIAQKNNVTLPDQPTNKQKAAHDRLAKLSGVEFDRAFARAVSRGHNKDISEFQKMSQKASNEDVKQFAGDTVGSLKEHHQMAMDITNVSSSADGKAAGKRSDESQTPRTDEPSTKPDRHDESSKPDRQDESPKPNRP